MRPLHNFKIILSVFLVGVGIASPRSAFPIGRIGTGQIGDATERYVATIPTDFAQVYPVEQDSLVMQSNYMLDPELGLTVDIHATPFSTAYPALVSAKRTAVLAYFKGIAGMNYKVLRTPNCSLSLIGESATAVVGISTWGNGVGYVLAAPKADPASQGIVNILRSTVIEDACWK